MASNTGAVLRDQKIIDELTKGADLTNPTDIEKVYKALLNGNYIFESNVGRDFDDEIYELHTKVLSGEIKPKEAVKGKKKIFKANSIPKLNAKSEAKSYVNAINDANKGVKRASTPNRNVNDSKNDTRVIKNKSTAAVNSKKIDNDDEALSILIELELKKQEKRRKLIILLASLVAVGSLGYFGVYYYISVQNTARAEQLSNLKGNDVLASLVDDEPKEKFTLHKQAVVLPDILDDYKTLYVKNNDLAGWLKIEGTKIDYPVMQCEDNDFYLKHDFNKNKDGNGSLFLDCSCSLYPRSTNMIIYGHHMTSGVMFGTLNRYAKESFYKEHKKIIFDSIYETAEYEVMYVFYSKVYDNDDLVFKYYQFINANSEKEFNYYMDEMEKIKLYDTGVTAHYGDTLLTLSTCEYNQKDGRFAVVAKRVK